MLGLTGALPAIVGRALRLARPHRGAWPTLALVACTARLVSAAHSRRTRNLLRQRWRLETLAALDEKDLRFLLASSLPAWVAYPDMEKVRAPPSAPRATHLDVCGHL